MGDVHAYDAGGLRATSELPVLGRRAAGAVVPHQSENAGSGACRASFREGGGLPGYCCHSKHYPLNIWFSKNSQKKTPTRPITITSTGIIRSMQRRSTGERKSP